MAPKNIAVFTGSRSDYGLLHWLMKDIERSELLKLNVIVGGMHLAPQFGSTWKQIEADGFGIDAKVEMVLSGDSDVAVAKSIGVGVIGFADSLDRLRPDIVVVLGDRYEALSIAQVAHIMQIPIAHIHGGELTEGAYDDAIRHAITKFARLHFVAAEEYRRRVIQMGEPPETVFNVGALGLDHLRRTPLIPQDKLDDTLGFCLGEKFILSTFHPATLTQGGSIHLFEEMLNALDAFPDYKVVITYPNADDGSQAIIERLEHYAMAQPNRVLAVRSLGSTKYLSVMARAAVVIGNSSSGIIEAPSLGVPSVNLGSRQLGRLSAASVIHCDGDSMIVRAALARALAPDFADLAKATPNPYDSGDAAGQIVRALENVAVSPCKHFYTLGDFHDAK